MSVELPSKKIKDIRGERFGRLVVRSFSHIAQDKGKNAYWDCECNCGKNHRVSSSSLRSGSCVSCGCFASEISRQSIKKLHQSGKDLYLIQCGEYIKIGRADNVKLRLSQLKAANPYPVKLLKVVKGAGHLEHELHEKYKKYHHTGEWFALPVCEVVNIGN